MIDIPYPTPEQWEAINEYHGDEVAMRLWIWFMIAKKNPVHPNRIVWMRKTIACGK